MYIALMWEDFVEMDQAELCTYYGWDVFPQVPSDLANWHETGEDRYGIFRRKDGTVYCDQNVVNYSNEDATRVLHIALAKGNFPHSDVLFDTQTVPSTLAGVEMALGRTESGDYFARFLHRDVGFEISAQGLSQEEFLTVLASLVDS